MRNNPLNTPKLRALGPMLYFLERRWRQALPDGRIVIVPQGVRISFESAPRWFWRLLSPLAPDICAPVLTYEYLVGQYTRQLDVQPLCESDDGVRECRTKLDMAIVFAVSVLAWPVLIAVFWCRHD